MSKQVATKEQTYMLSKYFYFLKNAQHYLEAIANDDNTHSMSRRKFKDYASRIQWLFTDLYTRLDRESADMLKAETDTYETLVFDSVFQQMMLMSPQQREVFEECAIEFRKGLLKIEKDV